MTNGFGCISTPTDRHRNNWSLVIQALVISPPMDFDQELQKAIQRGHRRHDARAEAQRRAALTEEEYKRLHAQFRLQLSERIEECMRRLPNHFPGFRYETMLGDRGWGAACFRDDLRLERGPKASDYSRLEMT